MNVSRTVILVLTMAAVATLWVAPCVAAQQDDANIWTQDEQRGPRSGRGPGPESRSGKGPRRGPWPGSGRFDLTEEEIDRIMKGLAESDPAKAKELAGLREKDPEKFKSELRRHGGREAFGRVIRERIEAGRRRRRAEFIKYLEDSVPKQAQELAKLQDKDADLYMKKYDLVWKKYGRTFDESRRNPELAEVLVEDIKLQERRDELARKISASSNDREKRQLTAQLEEVVASRFDLIVRRKQIAYDRLLGWLEGLQKRVKESKNELGKWMNDDFKAQNVAERVEDLTGMPGFKWD